MIGLRENSAPVFLAPFGAADFDAFLKLLDSLYDAAATGTLNNVSDVDWRMVAGWLKDIQSTAGEILEELHQQ